MALLHEGAAEGGRELLAFFFSNALVVEETGVNGDTKMKEVDPLDYQKELNMIKDNLSKSGRQIRFFSSPATFWEVQNRLIMGCKMLHFTGHGCGEYLGFEANETERCGVLERLTVDGLKELFEAGQPELVFFGSCSSEAHGNALVEAGVPHVVAVRSQDKVEDETARIFSNAFYRALIAGNRTVKKAFDIAVTAVNNKDLGIAVNNEKPNPAEKFLLLPENGNHDVRMFDDLPKGEFTDETPQLPIVYGLPGARKTYFGAVGLQKAVSVLQNPDAACVSIVGEAGIGKTERALQAAYYTRERKIFYAIFFADFKKVISQRPSLPIQGSRSEVERYYKQCFCQLIAMALGWNPESNISAQQLWEFLMSSVMKMGNPIIKTLLILDGVDALYEDRGEEARTSLVKVLDDLCCISPNLKLLLTCKEQLLKNTDERLSNTKELVHKVGRLEGKDPALLLWHLSPRGGGCGLYYEDIDAPRGCSVAEIVQHLQKLELVKIAGGHPGTLCHVAPRLWGRSMRQTSVKRLAARYLAQLKNKLRKPFSETRARAIASSAGLKDPRCISVWVGATKAAEAEGRSVRGDKNDAHYYSVPWRYLSEGLDNWLCYLQTTGDIKEQPVDGDHNARGEGSGRSFSNESCYHSGAGWVRCGQDLGHRYTSTFKPRKLTGDDLLFVCDVLWSSKPLNTGHLRRKSERSSNRGDLEKAGEHTEQKGYTQSESEDEEEAPIALEKFVNFCTRWWEPVMATLSLMLKDWTPTNPMKVHGFISRLEAEHRLRSSGEAGVFLLRFSESRPGLLILTFASEGTSDAGISNRGRSSVYIQHSLVTVQSNGRWTLHYDSDTRHGISYPSLRDLVLDKGTLLKLYPDVTKRSAFETSS